MFSYYAKSHLQVNYIYVLYFGFSVRPDIVRLGDQNLVRNDDRARPQDFGVSDVIAHPDYRHASHYNDIAVIKLNSRVR